MFFGKDLSSVPVEIHHHAKAWHPARLLVFCAMLATLSAILQSSGGWIPIAGLLISPFSTLPILVAVVLSYRYGLFTYFLAALLLFLLEPSEFFILPFTTGLLGVSLAVSYRVLKCRLLIILLNGFVLCMGICIPLYLLKFPVFGPMTTFGFRLDIWLGILIFSTVYSWIWVEFGLFFLRKIKGLFGPEG